MQATSIYKPIQPGLSRVEESLKTLDGGLQFPFLSEVLGHIMDTTGKAVRPAITLLSASFHPNDGRTIEIMAAAVELLRRRENVGGAVSSARAERDHVGMLQQQENIWYATCLPVCDHRLLQRERLHVRHQPELPNLEPWAFGRRLRRGALVLKAGHGSGLGCSCVTAGSRRTARDFA